MKKNQQNHGVVAEVTPLYVALKLALYAALAALAVITLIPFAWMLSSSLKLDREVFSYPIRWVPETVR